MFTIWTNTNWNPSAIHPTFGEPVQSVYEQSSAALQAGYVGPDLPLSEWQGDSLAFVRPDGSAILF